MSLAALESAFSSNPGNINAAHALIEGLRVECERKDAALRDARFALNHAIPSGCWTIGPLTGDVIHDHVSCPGCHAISMIESALASTGEG